jgi:AcrR family transcriptional regulator
VKTALEKAREAPGSTKARILAAAEEVFAERGFEGASTREIAARAAVNISSLHYHWESKETLYFTVFQNVFDRIVDRLQNTLGPLLARHSGRDEAIGAAMGEIFDFFTDNPNVPKLLLRRIVDDEAIDVGIDRDVLLPAWNVFAEWLGRIGRDPGDEESRLFMLSLYAVTLVYVLDSQLYRSMLGGSVRSGPLRTTVRDHLVQIVRRLLGT